MNFMGMGMQELVVIAIAGIVIFGPDRLPELASQAAKLMKDLRRMTADMTGEFEKQTGVNPLELRQQVEKEVAGFKAQIDDASGSIQKEVNKATGSITTTASKAAKSVNTAAAGSKTGAKSTSTTKPSSTTTSSTTASKAPAKETVVAPPVATKKNPFADMAHFENPAPVANGSAVNGDEHGGDLEADTPMQQLTAVESAAHSPAISDAVARARQRRGAAGYNAPVQ